MAERIQRYFSMNIFSQTGWIDCACFVAAVLVLFYEWKGFTVKNVALLLAHVLGLYAALLLFNCIFCLISENNIVLVCGPKLFTLVLYIIFFNRYSWQAKVILGGLIFACYLVFTEIGGSFQGIFNAHRTGPLPTTFRCYFLPLAVIAAAFIRWFNVNKFRRIPTRTVIWSIGYCLIGIVLSILRSVVMPYLLVFERTEYYLYGLYPQIYIFVTLLCIAAFMFACYFFMVRDLKAHEENMELSKKGLRKEVNDTLVAMNENNLDQLRKIRHEIKNRYAVMQVMLHNKQYAQLEAYFQEINSESAVLSSHVETGNAVFDMIFNLEFSKMTAKNIEVTTKLIIPPEIPMAEMDLSSMITNLMDNAIEACDKIQEGARMIDVSAQIVHSYFIFRISNTIAEEKTDSALSLETDKPNKELHGYGSKIVDDIVRKYNGHVLRRVQDNRFFVDIMLDLDYKDAEQYD